MNDAFGVEENSALNQSGFRKSLPWALSGLAIALGVLQVVLNILANQVMLSSTYAMFIESTFALGVPIAFSLPAALILRRQPANRVAWLMMMTAYAASNPLSPLMESLRTPPDSLTLEIWILIWIDNWSWTLLIFPIFLIPLHFPDGRLISPRWRWVNILAVGLTGFMMIAGGFSDMIGPVNESWLIPNPIGFFPSAIFNDIFLIFWGIPVLTVIGASVISLFIRYRSSGLVTRDQIKWVLYGGVLFFVSYGLAFYLNETFSDTTWVNLIFSLSLVTFPVAITIAILRYRLYDINLIIRRTAQYAVLTGLLAFLYFGGIVLLQGVFENVSGEGDSPLITVVSTLGIAALFNPLRTRVQEAIERRFYRQKYDSEQSLARFAAAARDEVDLDVLTESLVSLVQQTMQPTGASLLLRNEPNQRPASGGFASNREMRNES